MDRQILEDKYMAGTLSRQGQGQLRRLVLQEILNEIIVLPVDEARGWLDKKYSKLDRAKLANAVGYGIRPVNLRQSYKDDIEVSEEKLRNRKVIVNEAKTTKEIGDENITNFLAFINERLNSATSTYEWPVTNNNRVHQRRIWSYFLEQNYEEVKSAPSFFWSDSEVSGLLASIDLMIAKGEIKTISYASETALDEMKDTMTSAAISKLRQQLKNAKDKLASEREERKTLETKNYALKKELEQYQARDKAMSSSNISAIKIAGAH